MKPVLLIVDDEKSTRTALCAALEDDYEVYPPPTARPPALFWKQSQWTCC